ncbi:MAG TPA: ribosome biogenesis GTP-binding protein YihA/YsxC [Ignavibacteriaceae bacterium]|nr:ribosome biogenesis GTP-binding protein YihA/YsxC [Ignavibacteriaceae bacterium]
MLDESKFVKSVFTIKELPKDNLPEIILCGRSNVGKSSFLNSLFNKKDLAKTSSTPGKTRSINYYLIDKKFYMVDLPGFGYAKISKAEREYWARLIQEFLRESNNIWLAFHLIDSRHKPTELDFKLNAMLHFFNIPFVVLLSKIDKLKQSEISNAKKNAIESFPELSFEDNLLIYSAVKNFGHKEILQRLSKIFY